MEEQIKEKIREIAQSVNEAIPVAWDNLFINISLAFDGGEVYYFFNEEGKNDYIYNLYIPKRYGINNLEFRNQERRTFGFHISIFKGLVELIWVVRDSQNKVILGTPLMEFSRRLISPDYRIMDPVIANYDDFENVMKVAFEMYEDFKQAFMKIAAED